MGATNRLQSNKCRTALILNFCNIAAAMMVSIQVKPYYVSLDITFGQISECYFSQI